MTGWPEREARPPANDVGDVDMNDVDVPACRAIIERLRECGVPDDAVVEIEFWLDECEATQGAPEECAACGHIPACGHASVTKGDLTLWYCHADDHSCYVSVA